MEYSFNLQIKNIISKYVEDKYQEYISNNKILFIEKDILREEIIKIYNKNLKEIKTEIRSKLKNKLGKDYESAIIENVILEIFNDSELNINFLTTEIELIQENNLNYLDLPIINNSLNLNISLIDNYIVINSSNIKNIDDKDNVYENVDKYKFIYSINNIIIHNLDNDEKIEKIKKEIQEKDMVKVGLYYLKNNK